MKPREAHEVEPSQSPGPREVVMLKNCRDGDPKRSQTSKTPGLQGGGQRDIPRRSPVKETYNGSLETRQLFLRGIIIIANAQRAYHIHL